MSSNKCDNKWFFLSSPQFQGRVSLQIQWLSRYFWFEQFLCCHPPYELSPWKSLTLGKRDYCVEENADTCTRQYFCFAVKILIFREITCSECYLSQAVCADENIRKQHLILLYHICKRRGRVLFWSHLIWSRYRTMSIYASYL